MDKDHDDVVDKSSGHAGADNIVYLSDFASDKHHSTQYYLDAETDYTKSSINYYECMPTLSDTGSYDSSLSSEMPDTLAKPHKPSLMTRCFHMMLRVVSFGLYKPKQPLLSEQVINASEPVNISNVIEEGYVFYDKDYNLRLLKGTKRICIISDFNYQIYANKQSSNE
ncbi:MAG: hypothetical protein MK137_05695 [Rickettsiales bacterium]|nr:hypothetical protein [Rickettsiales bacterium]